MRRYNITTGSTTTVGGKVTSGCEGTSFNGEMISREGDRVACPACGTEGFIALTGPHLHEEWNGKQAALEGDLCICKCDPPPELIANQSSKSQEFGPQPQRVTPIVMRPTASASPPANYAAPAASNRAADACVFAKSCVSVPAGSTAAGTAPENAKNFGTTALMASTGSTGAVGRVAGTLGSELGAGLYEAWPAPVRPSTSCCWHSGRGISVTQRCTPRSSWRGCVRPVRGCVSSFARMSPVNCVFTAYIPNLAVALTAYPLRKPGGMRITARWWRCWMASASHGRRTTARLSACRARIPEHRNAWITCLFIRLPWGKIRRSVTIQGGMQKTSPGRIRSFRFRLIRVWRRCIWCLPSRRSGRWRLGRQLI